MNRDDLPPDRSTAPASGTARALEDALNRYVEQWLDRTPPGRNPRAPGRADEPAPAATSAPPSAGPAGPTPNSGETIPGTGQ
jgi:hypothetical protein